MGFGWPIYFIALFCGAIGAYLIHKKWIKNRKVRMLDKIPGPDYHFLFGNSLQLIRTREMFSAGNELIKNFRPFNITRLWLGRSAYVICLTAPAVEKLLSSTKWLDKTEGYKFLHNWLGTGLLTSTGAKWQSRRKLITPTFHFKILEDFLSVFNEQAVLLTSILEEQEKDGKHFDICPFLTRCTLDIICETAMGKCVNAQKNTNSEYMQAIRGMADVMRHRSLVPWLRIKWVYRMSRYYALEKRCVETLHEFTNQVIRERQRELKKHGSKSPETSVIGKKRRLAFLDMLIEKAEENKLTHDDIREEVDTFMAEGHDTTAAGLVWVLYNIGRFPEVEENVYEEIRSVIGDEPREITAGDIKSLKYLECVIKESFRLFPPVPLFGRQLLEDAEICGYKIPAGVNMAVQAYVLHRDPKYFPDPEKFDPERFSPENSVGRHPYAYVPFSAGPRNCIGQKFAMMEEKILVSRIVQRFKINSLHKPEEIPLVDEIVLRPINGMWIKLENRQRSVVATQL